MSELSMIPEALTMTSLEIADLVESNHADVRRSIERLAASLDSKGNPKTPVITLQPMAEVSNPGPGPKMINIYRLSKRDSLIVVAQLCPEFTARLVDRWQELEAQVKGQYIAPQVLKDLIEGAAERAVENYKALDSVNFNMLKQDIAIMDILACKAGHGPDGIKRLTVQLLRKYGRPDLIGMLEMLGEVSDYDQHQSWAAVEELAQSYLKELVAARKQAGKKPLPEPTPEELEAVSLNWRMKYMPYSLVTNPVFVTHLTSEVSAPVSAAKAFARNHINMSLNRVTGQTTATWNGSANLNQLLLAK